jgi:MFS family permease
MHDSQSTEPVAQRAGLRTPKAAAIAGLLFASVLATIFLLLRSALPADPREPGVWLAQDLTRIEIALNLMPFAAIAFLWFIGFLRDRLGRREDRFFSTMILGSGLLFLSMLFTLAALMGAILVAHSVQPQVIADSPAFHIVRAVIYSLANIYITKMAAVFMIATSKVTFHGGIAPRWLTVTGYGLSLSLLFGSQFIAWSFIVFPFWMLLLSGWMLMSERESWSDHVRHAERSGSQETG